MRGNRGRIWLAAVGLTLGLLCAPGAGKAASIFEKGGPLPFTQVAAQSPMEAQMLGEEPFQSHSTPAEPSAIFSNLMSGLRLSQEGGAAIQLPHNLELQVSVHYWRDPAMLVPQKGSDSLITSSLDFRLLPNLKVGLNAYLYRPEPENNFSLARPFGERGMGLGPGLKYDLGRWSFLLKSQVATTERERGDLQNWVRVWYAF